MSTSDDFAEDAFSAVEFLKLRKEVDPKKIGIIGHSEGGVIAPMCAAKSKDVAFIVRHADAVLVCSERLGSELLLADATQTRGDVWTSATVIVALIGARLGMPILDPIAAIVVAAFIGHAGYQIARATTGILSDQIVIADSDLEREITRTRPDGTQRVINVRWYFYHILEHYSGHYGQVLLLRHLYKAAHVPAKT
jgi:pimeloyl-ACP methyl ester carboxylesterase